MKHLNSNRRPVIESRETGHRRGASASKKDAHDFQPLLPVPKYSKHKLGNWRGTVWKYAAIPRGWLHFVVAVVLAGLFVMLMKELDKRKLESTETSTNVEEIDEDAPLTYKGLEVLLQNAIAQAGAGQQEGLDWNWDRPYPYQVFAFILGFLLVFRTNIAYQRFWEGCTMLQKFSSKLTDVLHLALALDNYNIAKYDISGSKHYNLCKEFGYIRERQQAQKVPDSKQNVSEDKDATEKELQDLRDELELGKQKFKNTLCHLISLLHAVGLSTLRDDHNMANIVAHFTGFPLESKGYMSETSDPEKYAFLNELIGPDARKEFQGKMDVEEHETSAAREFNHFESVVKRQRWQGHVALTAVDKQKEEQEEEKVANTSVSRPHSLLGLAYWQMWRIFQNRTVDDSDYSPRTPSSPSNETVTYIPHRKTITGKQEDTEKKPPTMGQTVKKGYDVVYKELIRDTLWRSLRDFVHMLLEAYSAVQEWLLNVFVHDTTTWTLSGNLKLCTDEDSEHLQKQHKQNKLGVIGGMSMAEGISLGAQATDTRFEEMWRWHTKDMNHRAQCVQWLAGVAEHEKSTPGHQGGLSMRYLPSARERAQVVHAWINQLIVERMCLEPKAMDAGDQSLRSRVTAYLSDAMLAYEQCKKLTQVQLPYAWYQCCHLCLTFLTLTLPFVAAFWMREYWLAMPTAGFTVLLFATMNEIANGIEEPFKFYPALIPLTLKQWQFNERLIAISNTRRPLGFADILKDVNDPRGYLQLKRARFREATVYAGEKRHPHKETREDTEQLYREVGSTCNVVPIIKDGTSRAVLDYTYEETLPVPEAFMMYRTGTLHDCRFSQSIKKTLERRHKVWSDQGELFNLTDEFDKAASTHQSKQWALDKELIFPLRCMVAPSPLFVASDRKREEQCVGLGLSNAQNRGIRARTQTGWTKLARSMLKTPVQQDTENQGYIEESQGADHHSSKQSQDSGSRTSAGPVSLHTSFTAVQNPQSPTTTISQMPPSSLGQHGSTTLGGSSGGSSMDYSAIPAAQYDNPTYEPRDEPREGSAVILTAEEGVESTLSLSKTKEALMKLIPKRLSFTNLSHFKPGVECKSKFDGLPYGHDSSSSSDSSGESISSRQPRKEPAPQPTKGPKRKENPFSKSLQSNASMMEEPSSPKSGHITIPSGQKAQQSSSSNRKSSSSQAPSGPPRTPHASTSAPKAIKSPVNTSSTPSKASGISGSSASATTRAHNTPSVPSSRHPAQPALPAASSTSIRSAVHQHSSSPQPPTATPLSYSSQRRSEAGQLNHSSSKSQSSDAAQLPLRARFGVSAEQPVGPMVPGMHHTGNQETTLESHRSANGMHGSQPPQQPNFNTGGVRAGVAAVAYGKSPVHPSTYYTASSGIDSSPESSQMVSGPLPGLQPASQTTVTTLDASEAQHQHLSGASNSPNNPQQLCTRSTREQDDNNSRAHSPYETVSATGATHSSSGAHVAHSYMRSASDVYGPRSRTKSPENLLPTPSHSPSGHSLSPNSGNGARGASPPRPSTPNPPRYPGNAQSGDVSNAVASYPVSQASNASQLSHTASDPRATRPEAPGGQSAGPHRQSDGQYRSPYQRSSYYGS